MLASLLARLVCLRTPRSHEQGADLVARPRSVQHCLPIAVTLSVNSSFVSDASFTVNSTDLRSTYNVHPYVENGNLVRHWSVACRLWASSLACMCCANLQVVWRSG